MLQLLLLLNEKTSPQRCTKQYRTIANCNTATKMYKRDSVKSEEAPQFISSLLHIAIFAFWSLLAHPTPNLDACPPHCIIMEYPPPPPGSQGCLGFNFNFYGMLQSLVGA